MIAYKGFHKDIDCTQGKGTFTYEPGKWYTEDMAKCGSTGFHATYNPLDVLCYYNGEGDRYFIVELRGNIDEDGTNTRIAAPEIRLLKEITKAELYEEGIVWMSRHPGMQWPNVVKKDKGEARDYVLVVGQKPKAKGQKGAVLYLVRTGRKEQIIEVNILEVDGEHIKENTYYDIKGEAVL